MARTKATAGVKAALPATLAPQLATLVGGPTSDPKDWVFEIKFDGYRVLTRVQGDRIQLFTRNGNDWTTKLGRCTRRRVWRADRMAVYGQAARRHRERGACQRITGREVHRHPDR
ncbi:hypothetical protein [Rhodoferax saidenbachensis]|uniref:ATP-dependent DNA ligase n=1 Tax=Rhodoferax saidenbachensis TaxID=1484693 RepID=A0ABU1ZKU0_9BURK|nr:hypothetical protein [Rhodoferax saidenbachensis]MDR7306171.1 ATP-dependent DNA ligase [Rhodoferax saidenbachensis]